MSEIPAHDRPRVLLTGASGFLGTPCRELLVERGHEVHAVSQQQRSADGVRWHRADLLDTKDVARLVGEVRPTHLLHLAWTSGRDGFRDGTSNYPWVGATIELLRRFTEAGGRRVVAVGTGAEYDWSGGVCHETETPLRPSSTYGLCKRTTGELFGKFLEQHEGISGAWARLFFLYGPGEDDYRLLPSIVSKILRGETAEVTFDRLERDYLFIDDAARGLVDLLESDTLGPINLAAGEAVSLGRLVGLAAEKLGRSELLRLGGEPSGPHPAPLVVADVERAKTELGWRPRYSLDEGLGLALEQYAGAEP